MPGEARFCYKDVLFANQAGMRLCKRIFCISIVIRGLEDIVTYYLIKVP